MNEKQERIESNKRLQTEMIAVAPGLPGKGVGLARRLKALRGCHAIGLGAVLLGTLVNAIVLTDGTTDLTRAESTFGTYYDALGESLLEGRFDVPPPAIGPEAFLIDGKTYGYFGPTPALLRIPLDFVFPGMRGGWTRLMMLAACALTLLPTYLILHRAGRAARSRRTKRDDLLARQCMEGAFVLCAAVGTSLFFIMRSPTIYHEASAIAVMFAVWTFLLIIRYQERGRLVTPIAAFFCALLSFQARGSVGAGPMLAICLLLLAMGWTLLRPGAARHVTSRVSHRRLAVHTAIVATIAGLCTSAVLIKNVMVFGNLVGAPPLSRHVQLISDPARLALTDGGNFIQPGNVRTTLYNYLNPFNVVIGSPFPFIRALPAESLRTFPETRLDHKEPFASLTGTNPLWCVLAALGIAVVALQRRLGAPRLRRFGIALAGAAAGAAPILMSACITQRYLHDAYPLLVIAGAAGLQGILVLEGGSRWARALAPALILLALYTCFANISVAMTLPRWE
ncbi:MAG TPA: hypothetical protein VFG76_05940 [Candidatus Polarisedimenticolia bacterium]|nr:hypothetical protein [Candidatus Polarisedimenticolia bacterium]